MSLEEVLSITKDERRRIIKSYDRSEEEINGDIETLKIWLKKQSHLPKNEDEIRLRSMLIRNKFSLEKTKQKLDVYYSARNVLPDYFVNREPNNPDVSYLMDQMIIMPLPHLTPELNRIFYIKVQGENFNLTTYAKVIFGMLDVCMMFDDALAEHYIMDFEKIQLSHVVQCTPEAAKKIYELFKKAYSDRIAGLHIVNMPAIANAIFLIITSILSEKLANRVKVHKDYKELCKTLPPSLLPNECGGTAGPENELYDNWKKFYRSKNDWLKELSERKSDESKRVGKPFDSCMFGTEGSFRKLTLD